MIYHFWFPTPWFRDQNRAVGHDLPAGERHQPVHARGRFFHHEFIGEALSADLRADGVSRQAQDVAGQHRRNFQFLAGGRCEVPGVDQEFQVKDVGHHGGRQFREAHVDGSLQAADLERFERGLGGVRDSDLRCSIRLVDDGDAQGLAAVASVARRPK
ncbi:MULTISPECIES: hypothetical protein [unclassified Arthrobacter]|uniref:hypothetical protein n=1 Tax=Pseudarthrobacter sp. S6 TaxID=3418420 RepID=UPI003393CDD2